MNKIKELRKKHHITVAELAKKLGISQSMLTNYENGNTIPRDEAIWEKLSQIFGVSKSHVMGLTTDIESMDEYKGNEEFATKIIEEIIEEPITVHLTTKEEFVILSMLSYLDDADKKELLLKALELHAQDKYEGKEAILPIKFV